MVNVRCKQCGRALPEGVFVCGNCFLAKSRAMPSRPIKRADPEDKWLIGLAFFILMVGAYFYFFDSESAPKKVVEPKSNLPLSARLSYYDIKDAVKQSDDFAKYEAAFVKISRKLIDAGICTIADYKKMGGWLKSYEPTTKYEPVYFTYCGGLKYHNKVLIDLVQQKLTSY